MIREKLGAVFSSKVFYIAFSILVAFILWMYVEINENQVQIHTVRDVQVVRKNSEVLNDRGLLITAINPETVTLEFECPRSISTKLSNSTLSVVIDLISITSRGSTALEYDIIYPTNIDPDLITRVSKSVNQISLRIDRLATRSVPVDVAYRGGTASGFIQDPLEYSPQAIKVSGPADLVSQVGMARVDVVRENLSSTYTDDLAFVLLDENGEELSEQLLNQLTLIDETVHVAIPIRMTKEVALTVDISPGAGATSQNTRVTISPPTIMIAGDPEDARDFNSINLGTIDLTSFDFDSTYDFPIVLPNYFTKLSGESQASVIVEVLGLEIRHLSVTNIQTVNEPPGNTVEIITQSMVVRIRGRAEDMENLTEANIRVIADLTDRSPGTHRVPARIRVDGIEGDVDSVGNYLVTVQIIKDS